MSDQPAGTTAVIGEKRERNETDESASPSSPMAPASTPTDPVKAPPVKPMLKLKSVSKSPSVGSPTNAPPAVTPPSLTAPIVRRPSYGSPLLGLSGTFASKVLSPTVPASPLSRSGSSSTFSNSNVGVPKELRYAAALVRVLEPECASCPGVAVEYIHELCEVISRQIAKEADPTSCMQTMYPFLKEPANSILRQEIIKGDIPPERLVQMPETELMNKEAREKVLKEAKRRAMDRDQEELSKSKAMNSTMFKCAKCGKRDTSYYEKQVRSADEPMTLFITCNKCSHLWRIG